jgi:hypothetical protein
MMNDIQRPPIADEERFYYSNNKISVLLTTFIYTPKIECIWISGAISTLLVKKRVLKYRGKISFPTFFPNTFFVDGRIFIDFLQNASLVYHNKLAEI